jgi:hypothetical protein
MAREVLLRARNGKLSHLVEQEPYDIAPYEALRIDAHKENLNM